MRLDKWLWAARFLKTRSMAADAVESGKVKVNDERSKPAKLLKVGDRLAIRVGPFSHAVTVLGLSDRRGPSTEAQKLYVESEESLLARQRLRDELRANTAVGIFAKGRPTKRERRKLEEFKDRGDE